MSSEKETNLHEKSLGKIEEFKLCQISHALTKEEALERRNRMLSCNHLYLKLEDGKPFYACNSSDCTSGIDKVECVYCGLTNRFKETEYKLWISDIKWTSVYPFRGYYLREKAIETEVFDELYEKMYLKGGDSFNCSRLNMLSDKPLKTTQVKFLFDIAKEISPNGSGEEIREIMGELDLLEEFREKRSFGDDEFAKILKERYYSKKREEIKQCDHFLFFLGKTPSNIEKKSCSIYECPYCGLYYKDGDSDSLDTLDPFENAIGIYNLYEVWPVFSDRPITSMEYEDKIFRKNVERIIANNIKTLINNGFQKNVPEILNEIITLYGKKMELQGEEEDISSTEKLRLLALTSEEYFSKHLETNKSSAPFNVNQNVDHMEKVKVLKNGLDKTK